MLEELVDSAAIAFAVRAGAVSSLAAVVLALLLTGG
jgi:hypothetical protein